MNKLDILISLLIHRLVIDISQPTFFITQLYPTVFICVIVTGLLTFDSFLSSVNTNLLQQIFTNAFLCTINVCELCTRYAILKCTLMKNMNIGVHPFT